MNARRCYVSLIALGSALPLFFLVEFLLKNGLDIRLFFLQLFANPVSRFFAMDVVVSAVVSIVFILIESRRLRIRGGYWCMLGLVIGVSLALPLFLFVRQRHINKQGR